MSKDETQPTPTDETPTDVTPTGETPEGVAGATPETSPTPSTTPATQPESADSSADDLKQKIEQLETALKKANKEAAAHRVKAKELDDLKAQAEQEKLTEKERLEKKIADLQKAHDDATRSAQEFRLNAELRVQALQLGFADAGDAARLLDHAEIEYADDGTPTNVADLLKALLKSKPYLAAQQQKHTSQTTGGATNPPRSQSNQPAALSWDTITKMTQTEYDARHTEIAAW